MSYIYETGVRDGELITSAQDAKPIEGSIMQIFGFYPPSNEGVDKLKLTTLRDTFDHIPYFKNLSLEDRKKWLKKNAVDDNDLYLNDLKDLKVKFLSISGDGFAERLTEEQQDYLLNLEEPISIRKVYEMTSGYEKKKGRKHLLFRPSLWTLLINKSEEVDFRGFLIDLEENKVEKYKGTVNTAKVVILGDERNIAIKIPTTKPYLPSELKSLIDEDVENLIKWFSPSVHKSLIQKIIRTRAEKLDFMKEVEYDGNKVLVTSFCMLLKHPGTFEPDLKRHTSGLESACKRLAVSIAEDGYAENHDDLLGLFAAAYVAKVHKQWKPSLNLIKKWIEMALNAWNDSRMYDYKIKEIELEVENDPLNLSYHILKETKSLSNDIPMLGQIAKNGGKVSEIYNHSGRVNVPIVHCIDQHNIRDLAWHFPYERVKDDANYLNLFKAIWDNSSSINPRKRDYKIEKLEESEFMRELRVAQYETWLVGLGDLGEREVVENERREEFYILDNSWLSALVGPREKYINITRNKKRIRLLTVCVVDPNNIDNLIVVPKPVRESTKKDEPIILDEDEKKEVIDDLYEELEDGVTGLLTPSLRQILGKVVIKYKKGTYYVNDVEWEKFRKLKFGFDIHPDIEIARSNACIWVGDGIESEHENKIKNSLEELDKASKFRLLTYIDSISSRIQLHKIALDGTGVYYEISPTDTAVYNFLAELCVILPGVIEVERGGFKIKHGPMAWKTFEFIREKVNVTKPETKNRWKIPRPNQYQLYDHQKEALERMIVGGRRHLIYITVGLGKTLIAINYIKHLIESNKMPKYCVYTLPPSAYEGVRKQFESYKIPTNLLDLRKRKDANTELLPGVINFLYHDQLKMRDFGSTLSTISNDLFFLVDEFHLALSKTTLRTSNILRVARVAKYLVGMTGTLVTDDHAENLMQWLNLVAKFEVTRRNYWCAIGLLVASRIQTDVVVVRENHHIELSPEEKKEHDVSFEKALKVSYEVVENAIVKEALKYIKGNESVFIVAKDKAMQDSIGNKLKGRKIFKITGDSPIDYAVGDKRHFDAIITTTRQSTGYTLTKIHIMIQSVYFSNQATRTQLEGRLNRIGQESEVKIITIHAGVLSYILERYDKIKSMADFVAGFAKVVSI